MRQEESSCLIFGFHFHFLLQELTLSQDEKLVNSEKGIWDAHQKGIELAKERAIFIHRPSFAYTEYTVHAIATNNSESLRLLSYLQTTPPRW